MTVVPATEPYPWPYDSAFDGPSTALVLAGWDEAWLEHVAPTEAAAATAACRLLASAVRGAGGAVLTVAHRGEAAAPSVHADATPITAMGLDGFWGGPLDATLRDGAWRHVLVAGHGLEAPVHSLLRGANDRGYECLLVLDACSALDPDLRGASSSMVCMSGGIFGAVGSVAAVIAALTPAFTPVPTAAPTPIPTGASPC